MQEEQQGNFQSEVIPENKKFINEKAPREYRISIQLITETSLDDKMIAGLPEDDKISAVIELKSIHLEWLNIRKIENLQVFTNLNVLYLQNNLIEKIQHLDCLKNLQYLALNDNLITKVENLLALNKLAGLNLARNRIEELDAKQLPQSLQLVSFVENAVCLDTNYKVDIAKRLPILQVLDGETITPEMRLKIIGKFPHHLIDYSERMKQFRNKQKFKRQEEEKEQNEKPLYLGGEFQQPETLKQIRDKTDKFMAQSQETFQSQIKDQRQDFEQKIKVSRKIRQFKQNNEAGKQQRLNKIPEAAEQHTEQN